jgi:hypothetical protein
VSSHDPTQAMTLQHRLIMTSAHQVPYHPCTYNTPPTHYLLPTFREVMVQE